MLLPEGRRSACLLVSGKRMMNRKGKRDGPLHVAFKPAWSHVVRTSIGRSRQGIGSTVLEQSIGVEGATATYTDNKMIERKWDTPTKLQMSEQKLCAPSPHRRWKR